MVSTHIPCILFEDDHLLVINKPAGIATHRAGEDAPWGIVEFLLNRKPNLFNLSIHQRLDRETSGILLFGKSRESNRSLTVQFENHTVRKIYRFITTGNISSNIFTATEPIGGKSAKTNFRFLNKLPNGTTFWEAIAETGRAHQVRLHAAQHHLPIIGDCWHVGQTREPLLLHAARLEVLHPVNQRPLSLEAPIPPYFEQTDIQQRCLTAAMILRCSLFDEKETIAYRLIHHEPDGFPSLIVERLGDWLYVESFKKTNPITLNIFTELIHQTATTVFNTKFRGMILSYCSSGARREDKQLLWGEKPSTDFAILENGIRYCLDPMAPGGIGLFLDQKENRRRIRNLASGLRILNLFAYTCGFSVAAALGGARETVNVDLSRRNLEVGRRNFLVNQLDPDQHQFLAEDAFEMLRRLATHREYFDIAILDPPSSSRSKTSGHFSVKRDLEKLVRATVPLITKGGWLFCAINLTEWKSEAFYTNIQNTIHHTGRIIREKIWMPQPFDFPVSKIRPAHLKSIWLRLK